MNYGNEDRDEETNANTGAVLNESLLEQYLEMDAMVTRDRLLPRLYSVFQKNFPDYLENLTQAVRSYNAEQVSHMIHKMLGMAHNIGALRLSQILLRWENLPVEEKMHIDANTLVQLGQEFKTAESALSKYIDTQAH